MKLRSWMSAAALTLCAPLSFAGLATPVPVVVTLNADGSGYAHGSLQEARRSSNTVEQIGCFLQTYYSGPGVPVDSYGWCSATDSTGKSAFCYSMNADALQAMHAISDAGGRINFSWDKDGACRILGIATASQYMP